MPSKKIVILIILLMALMLIFTSNIILLNGSSMADSNTGNVNSTNPAADKSTKRIGYDMNRLVGQPADISKSAYQYRADNKTEANSPESWFALMRFANLPLNKPVDVNNPDIKKVLNGLLWEEIRPVEKLELIWAPGSKSKPEPEIIRISTLMNQGTASSWWNNLKSEKQEIKPKISDDGLTYSYDLGINTTGIIVSIDGDDASKYDIPQVRVYTGSRWKKMDIEIEWGFDKSTAAKDYSGKIDVYDGIIDIKDSLNGDESTSGVQTASWKSAGSSSARRGVKASLLYIGTSKWRDVQPFISQKDDVARTIVTLWTKAGNFSFLAADLENGPILAPEYGFFIRRTSRLTPQKQEGTAHGQKNEETGPGQHISKTLISTKMDSIAGCSDLIGWGSDATPWFGENYTDKHIAPLGIRIPPKSIAMHPGSDLDVAVGWRSPIKGTVKVNAGLTHAQDGSNGIDWWIALETNTDRKNLASGTSNGAGSQVIPSNPDETKILNSIQVEQGDIISLVLGPKGNHAADTNVIDFVITEIGGEGRVWNLTNDLSGSIHEGNPHRDSYNNANVWGVYAQEHSIPAFEKPLLMPVNLASRAKSAKEYIKELKSRNLKTIRQRTREHDEQTWEYAVAGICGSQLGPNWPAHPKPPAEFESPMKVEVPSDRLTAQWNLGNWHLLRHASVNPQTGRTWFNDHPYGILAAETYMILRTLDLLGSHKQAEDGFYQWTSLPMQPNSAGHHTWALPETPNGLFTEGYGCLTHAVGPEGAGGQMDGVHAFGPGAIAYALTEHYLMSGDKDWLKASAPRIKANAEWMLRQRQVMSNVVPGGRRLWCKGLQPPLQVTPDSGGLWMQFYEAEAYYWKSIEQLAEILGEVDTSGSVELKKAADAYGKDLRAAVERSIALSPVVPVRDGTYHSVIPFGCYVRGLSTYAWGWMRDGSGRHVGPLYWETVQSAAPLISPAELLPVDDVRVQGYLDVLEDRLLLENSNARTKANNDWFNAGWQYQMGLEKTADVHLHAGDAPVFIRSWLNGYAANILPNDGYIFREHTVAGPPDKIFEEAVFLERFRNMLVMEDGQNLLLARATPRVWLKQDKRISVKNAPTHFGQVSYEIVSDVKHNLINAQIDMPERPVESVILKLRHPDKKPIKNMMVNGKPWKKFNPEQETVDLGGLTGKVVVEAGY